jgi:Domain of unknown function (DUF1924)
MQPSLTPRIATATAAIAAVLVLAGPTTVRAASPADILSGYTAQAGRPGDPDRGRQFFTLTHGREWSCASCHGVVPTRAGKHAATGKAIAPLAPRFNPDRFTDPARVEKWFRRNCNDVVGRECTASQKADVLGWLLSLQS